MKLLLDTHIFLWGFLEPERLPERIAVELEEPSNEIWLSPISVWESLILAAKGRVTLKPEPEKWIRQTLRSLSPREASLTNEVAIQSRVLNLGHEDPADRFLAATAIVFDLALVTVDERLIVGEGYRILGGD